MNPQLALRRLIQGNRRFTTGFRPLKPFTSQKKMAELALNGQRPFAIVLTCSDSRSPAEMIFDQGLGDLFVVRVAGNVIAPSLLASIEYAATNFGSALILVMGHTGCGAVQATVKHTLNPTIPLPSPHLENLLANIRPAVQATIDRTGYDCEHSLTELSVEENVRRSQRLILEQSALIRDLTCKRLIGVEAAILDISNGQVRFLPSATNTKLTNPESERVLREQVQ